MDKSNESRKFVDGMVFGLGFLFVISLVGTVFAVGFHYANEILPGTFSGDFIFDGDVNITSGNDLCVEGGGCMSDVGAESDPTVVSSVKDGVSWAEVTGKPAGFSDGVDNTGGLSTCYYRANWCPGTPFCTPPTRSGNTICAHFGDSLCVYTYYSYGGTTYVRDCTGTTSWGGAICCR